MFDGTGDTRSWLVRRVGEPKHALSLEAVRPRRPGAGEARVAVSAVGLNFPDLLLCAGRYQQRPEPPFAPGFEASGTVVAVGSGSAFSAGQRVIVVPELPNGAMQESLTVTDNELYPMPDTMPFEVGAVLHIAYQTAHMALHHRGGLRRGESVLVTGAAGGVGTAVVQLAHAAGARVIAVATGRRKTGACLRAGADDVIDLADRDVDLVTDVRDVTGGRGADVIVDVVGGAMLDQLRRCVAFEGRIVLLGFAAGEITRVPANHVLLRNYSVVGVHLAPYWRREPGLLRAVHDELLARYAGGAIAPVIDRELPLERAPEGLALLAEREVIGRVVLRV